jgi:hypothetical protein
LPESAPIALPIREVLIPLKDPVAKATYQRDYTQRTRAQKNEYMREFYAKRKERLRDLKQGLTCDRCGFDKPCALEFHHRDPATKDFTISKKAWQVSEERLLAEIEKCDVLCSNCHRIEHCDPPTNHNGRLLA